MRLFTSESVSSGHPDKVADQISDAVLDAILAKDPKARVACEVLVKSGLVLVAGEITTSAWVDVETLVRSTLCEIGYDQGSWGFSAQGCGVLSLISKQSPDISEAVTQKEYKKQGAGDQGLMFGYATDETPHYMPKPIALAHRLMERYALVRQDLDWLGPDAKAQVTVAYDGHVPSGIEHVVISAQHADAIALKTLREAVMEQVIRPGLGDELSKNTAVLINPGGRFVIGGPSGDCGLTGRKIIVDTYGGMARHGGGCFSGKDPSKVDRSAAYMARYVAKNLVAAGLASRLEVMVGYHIGGEAPVSVSVDDFGTSKIGVDALEALIQEHFDWSPYGTIEHLDLLRPIYQKTAAFGHFGRPVFPWERLDKVEALKA